MHQETIVSEDQIQPIVEDPKKIPVLLKLKKKPNSHGSNYEFATASGGVSAGSATPSVKTPVEVGEEEMVNNLNI